MKDWAATRQRLWWVLQRGGTDALGEEGAAALLKTGRGAQESNRIHFFGSGYMLAYSSSI